MEESGDNHPPHSQENEEDSELEFNCEPVKREIRYGLPNAVQRIPNSIRDIGIQFNARSKRKATMHVAIQGFSTGYVDQDTSGTYDPTLERASPSPTRAKRVRKRKAPLELDENGESRPKNTRRADSKLPIILKFEGEAGLNYLRSITPGTSTPSNLSEMRDKATDTQERGSDSNDSSQNQGRSSKRAKKVVATLRPDGLTIDMLTEDHRQRKGCKACFEFGDDDCSLIEDKHDYPCEACEDASTDCEMIIPPKFKQACERCKRKRLKCSYREDGGQGVDSCKCCEDAGETCIAGPLKGAHKKFSVSNGKSFKAGNSTSLISKGVSLHSSHYNDPPRLTEVTEPGQPARKFVSCNQCRENSLKCSLRRGQQGPCRECKKSGYSCKFVWETSRRISTPLSLGLNGQVSAPSSKNRNDYNDEETSGQHYSRTHTRPLYTKDVKEKTGHVTTTRKNEPPTSKSKYRIPRSNPPKSKLVKDASRVQQTTITTSFCHPIKFHYISDPDNKYPCSWCDSPVFGLWGHSPREVEVIPYHGNRGNEEIKGGHSEDGVEQTKMCVACTYERIKIMHCSGHRMKRIEGLDPKALDLRAIGQSLLALAEDDYEGAELVKRVKWCSLCVAPAEFACCTACDDGSGCGLHLCQTCEDLLSSLQKSWASSINNWKFMDELVKLWRADLWTRDDTGELRADVEFLITTGELALRMEQGLQISYFADSPLMELDETGGEDSSQHSNFQNTLPQKPRQNSSCKTLSLTGSESCSLEQTPGLREVHGTFISPTPPVQKTIQMSQDGYQHGFPSTIPQKQGQPSPSLLPKASHGHGLSTSTTPTSKQRQAISQDAINQPQSVELSAPSRSSTAGGSETDKNQFNSTSPALSITQSNSRSMIFEKDAQETAKVPSLFGGFIPSA